MGVSSGIRFDDYDKIPVEISGDGSEDITCIERFKDADMHPAILDNIERMKYNRPTPVQKYAIPVIIAMRDLMACAQTGSGKTAAFLFPTIQRLLNDGPPPSGNRRKTAPCALCMAPTRELCTQISDEACKFCFQTGMRAVCVYGGADIRAQMSQMERGCDIMIATPGRLHDFIERGRVSLKYILYFIMDEADRMLDMGFEPQIRRIVEEEDMSRNRQTIMFSATFPREIQQLAQDFLKDYIFLSVGRVGAANEKITQIVRYVDDHLKVKYLVKMLEEQTEAGLTLIFVETKRMADELEDHLHREHFPVVSIHGDRAQNEREEALRLFKSGDLPIMVATGVASRGLDIPNVNHVINFDLPSGIDDYVHRIGRTGRAGNTGIATSFVNDNCRILREMFTLLDEAKQEIPPWFQQLLAQSGGGGRFGGKGGGRNKQQVDARDSMQSRTVYTNTQAPQKKTQDARAPQAEDNTAF
jgi:ATP-dependent RNA helicase DDX3X